MTNKRSGWDGFLYRAEIYEKTMIGGETHEQYEAFLRGVYDDLTPSGTVAEYQVLRLAKLLWDRKRIDRYEQFKLEGKQLKIQETNTAVAELILLAPEFLKAKDVEEVEVLLGKLAPSQKQIIFLLWPHPKDCENPEQWGSQVAQGLSLFKLHPSSSNRVKMLQMHEYYYQISEPCMNDEIFSKLERIDNAIHRILKSIMQWKTMKQMVQQLEPKVIPYRKAVDTTDRKQPPRLQ